MGGEIGANHNAVGLEENCWRKIPFSQAIWNRPSLTA
jgi:hypothetical protein